VPQVTNPVVLAVKRVQAVVEESNRQRAEAQQRQTAREKEDFEETVRRYNAAAAEYLSIFPKDYVISMPNMHPQRKAFRRKWLFKCLKPAVLLLIGIVLFVGGVFFDLTLFAGSSTALTFFLAGICSLIGAGFLGFAVLDRPTISKRQVPIMYSKGNLGPWCVNTTHAYTYGQLFESIPYDIWCDSWHSAAAAYLQKQIEAVNIDDMPAVLAALDNLTISKES
jgi:hypothetical protein